MLDNIVENYRQDIIEQTKKLIQIPSVHKDSKNPYHPFGKNINNALEYMLSLGTSLGFRTKNIDGYCGYIEFGEGNDLVGIIGHLDVVPEEDNWTYPPFSGEIHNGNIYGRGAIDDKGPVISSLYAMKSVMDTCKIHKRVRLILGTNEERDWNCIHYYKEHEEIPTIGFSPDSDFPCIYAEKGVLSNYISTNYIANNKINITNIDCNDNPLNVVPKICSIYLKINSTNILMDECIYKIKSIIDKNNFEIDIYKINNEELKLTSHGIQAHAAHPDLGVNSISRLIIVLDELFKFYDCSLELFDFFTKFINTEFDGNKLGINFKDESGSLTLNVGNLSLEKNVLKIGMNLRIPVHTKLESVENIFNKCISSYSNLNYKSYKYMSPLYVPKDNYLVCTLCNIYNEMTNQNLEPIAIGGATYARAFPNCISFGANFPGNKDMCHQTDEFISIDNLILSCKIYAQAIFELAK